MKYNYKPASPLEKFGQKVYNALVENFPRTYFVGGMVRNFLLGKKILDIDIATSALPQEVVKILYRHGIATIEKNKNFGIIVAQDKNLSIEIATFRKEVYFKSRYPVISYIQNERTDSSRRDFTVNGLYLSAKKGTLLDYHRGLADLKKREIKFIGNPKTRISEDPLRIIRALRFALGLNFKLEKNTKAAIIKYFDSIKFLTKSKINSEVDKIRLEKNKKIVQKVINSPKGLDKYFK